MFGSLSKTSAVSCPKHIGVTAAEGSNTLTRMTSAGDSSALNAKLAASTGFSVELWLDHAHTTSDKYMPIFTIGKTPITGSNPFDCYYNSNFEVQRKNGDYVVNMAVDAAYIDDCSTLTSITAAITENAGPTHFVLTASYTNNQLAEVRIHLNGGSTNGGISEVLGQFPYPSTPSGSVYKPGFDTNWWSAYKLELFSDARAVAADGTTSGLWGPWPGTIYMAAMYDRVLSTSELTSNFKAKLSNSPPVVSATSVTINEDGELTDHYSNPVYYQSVVPAADLASITLTAYDWETDSSNTFSYSSSYALPTIYVSSLPATGTLLDYDGTQITSVPHALSSSSNNMVKYRPVKDASSGSTTVYTTFTFYAIDGVTGSRSPADATMSIYVLAKDDPPMATAASFTAYSGTTSNIMCVTGTDVDSGDSAVSGSVVTVPSHGKLYKVVSGSVTSTELSAGASFGTNQLCVGYGYTGTATVAVNGQLDTDSFTFTVSDTSGNPSTAATAAITIGKLMRHALRVAVGGCCIAMPVCGVHLPRSAD